MDHETAAVVGRAVGLVVNPSQLFAVRRKRDRSPMQGRRLDSLCGLTEMYRLRQLGAGGRRSDSQGKKGEKGMECPAHGNRLDNAKRERITPDVY
jgi:hypothetical protein